MAVNSTRNSVSSTRLKVGDKLGASEVGEWVVGKFVCGRIVGATVGPLVGDSVGDMVGPVIGDTVVGLTEVGEPVGDNAVGETVVFQKKREFVFWEFVSRKARMENVIQRGCVWSIDLCT